MICSKQTPSIRGVYFTLLELLFVIATIIILASLLLPSLRNAKKMGYRIGCQSNLKQIGAAWMLYRNDYDNWSWERDFWGLYPFRYLVVDDNSSNFVISQKMRKNLDAKGVFRCLELPDGCYRIQAYRCYIMNYHMCGTVQGLLDSQTIGRKTLKQPAGVMLMSDGNMDSDKDAVATSQAIDRMGFYHSGGTNIIFGDAHASWLKSEKVLPLDEQYNLMQIQ